MANFRYVANFRFLTLHCLAVWTSLLNVKNISILFDILGIILSSKESESRILKKFCSTTSLPLTGNEIYQNVAVMIKNTLKITKKI